MSKKLIPSVDSPKIQELLTPLLASLPAAAVSSDPPTALLPLLSPILRQRVQILSSSSTEPWISLLCYDNKIVSKLVSIASSPLLELHPVSGQVEIDWETDTGIRFKRVDSETLQTLVLLHQLDLKIKLELCVHDTASSDGDNGWRIGEVGIYDPDDNSWGTESLSLAEKEFISSQTLNDVNYGSNKESRFSLAPLEFGEEKEEDDYKYWAQYDNTAGQTPVAKNSPTLPAHTSESRDANTDEDKYYAKYSMIQPALDNNDPDESVDSELVRSKSILWKTSESPQILERSYSSQLYNCSEPWIDGSIDSSILSTDLELQPNIDRQNSSNGARTVALLEQQAASCTLSENAVKTHIGASMKSLYRLARATGIDRGEFDRIVRIQLDLLSIMGEDEDDF